MNEEQEESEALQRCACAGRAAVPARRPGGSPARAAAASWRRDKQKQRISRKYRSAEAHMVKVRGNMAPLMSPEVMVGVKSGEGSGSIVTPSNTRKSRDKGKGRGAPSTTAT